MADSVHATVSTIAAVATPPGPGAIGVLRLTGPQSARITQAVTGCVPPPRRATLLAMRASDGAILDRGLVLYFPAPASYTGEDLVEFHTHGSPAILAALLQSLYAEGACPARPGEFTERAFLNGKLDLLQAEAVADLISAGTEQALKAANLAMAGHFSRAIESIAERLVELRALLEAGIDFGDESSVEESHHLEALHAGTRGLREEISSLLRSARHGALLARGQRVVLCGPPNAGKSTLLNVLSGSARAIVSAQPGTTRDVLTAELNLGGMLVTLTDTAGLHEVEEEIEQEGIRRALAAIAEADLVLLVHDATQGRVTLSGQPAALQEAAARIIHVRNKIDLVGETAGQHRTAEGQLEVSIAARNEQGLEVLRSCVHQALAREAETDTPMLARERHLRALLEAEALVSFQNQKEFSTDVVETAERLRLAHRALIEMTGEFTSEDILGEIFGRFCIGK